MSVTKLRLKNMIFYGHHGVFDVEKTLGQRIEVDVELVGDFYQAGRTDALERTVDYGKLYQLVKTVIETEQYNLIEAVAMAVLTKIRTLCPGYQVTVRVRKPQPPVGGVMESVEFEISAQEQL